MFYFVGNVVTYGQNRTSAVTWVAVENSTAGVAFQMPQGYERKDTISTTLYKIESENVVLEVHYADVNAAPIEGNGSTLSDPLQTFVDLAIQATNGQLLSRQNVLVSGHQGVEIAISYTDEENQSVKAYHCYFWFNNKVYAFSTTANIDNSDLLNYYKNSFFASVNFSQ